ncbi:hypothetical protein ACHAXT_010798 [Thalassiosira profunda]
MNPSRRIDALSRRVLLAAGWPTAPSGGDSPTPHLDELERALDVRPPPLSCSARTDAAGDSGVRTCTLPTGMAKPHSNCNGGGGSGDGSGNSDGDVWTWTPRNTADNAYAKPLLDADESMGSTLEEVAPFSPDFYRAVGELAREAFHPGAVRGLEGEASANGDAAIAIADGASPARHDATTLYAALHSLEGYSLPRMHDAARMTRILLSMQEMSVGEGSFVQQLLHCCEGTPAPSNGESHTPTDVDAANQTDNRTHKAKRIPVFSALFHHWSHLPQLEHGLQRLSRKFSASLPTNAEQYQEYREYSAFGSGGGGSVGDGGSTGGEWRPSPKASFLGDRALRIDSFKQRLEEELECHINGTAGDKVKLSRQTPDHGGLVELLTLLYQHSDAALRGKCRRWMGQWLRAFALGGGSAAAYSTMRGAGDGGGGANASTGDPGLGPSFAAFCPLVVASSLATPNAPAGAGGMRTAAMAVAGPISITHAAGGGGGGMPHNPLGMENTSACGVEALLNVLLCIIAGFRPMSSPASSKDGSRRSSILRPSHERLLFDVVVPLHRPSGMVLWRDQTPLIGLYHEALVKSIGAFVALDGSRVGPVVGALLHPEIWPDAEGGNTPKVVLLLHEVDTLIGLLPSTADSSDDETHLASFDAHLLPLVSRLCACISSENSRTSERALQFFRNKTFQRLVQRRLDEVGPKFLHALCRCPSREVPWNPTVRKMTLLVLKEIEGWHSDDGSFSRACENAFAGVDLSNIDEPANEVVKSANGTAKVETHAGEPAMSGNMTTLRGAMGSWKPPTKARAVPGMQSRQPPSTITGVAPWAMGSQSRPKASVQKQPPLTVTGVAPWAMKKPSGLPPSLSSRKQPTSTAIPRPAKKHSGGSLGQPLPPITSCGNADEESEDKAASNGEANDSEPTKRTALEEVHLYMEKLKPKGEGDETSSDGISSWAKAQMEESPVLFPNLKFHDLVFGQELGTGAFSTVKYARRIVKTRTRSNWPEYAVKIVSTQRIEELGYEQSVQREIAILRTLSHPGISRLVSSFRFRDGAYLILEYASGGDLHSLLRKNGSLDHESTRFVIGSVAAALWSIHERGFVYADCKPENILITETGHIKVTDFGGCRPVTEEAKALVKESSKNLLQHLRDGDWKPHNAKPGEGAAERKLEEEEDLRIEGTTAYLPPEVVVGGYPTTAADVWALGCVMFQCISGRPPILEDTDDLTAQKIVTFDVGSEKHSFFGDSGESTFRDDAKALIKRMLHRDAACRPDILQMAEDDFFASADIFSLHRKPAYPLDVGSIAPTSSDAKWSRRQFSSIWAPQPRAYNIGGASNAPSKSGKARNEPISEGDEADEEFLPRQKAPLLSKIRE